MLVNNFTGLIVATRVLNIGFRCMIGQA